MQRPQLAPAARPAAAGSGVGGVGAEHADGARARGRRGRASTHAVAAAGQARVDAEHEHLYDASGPSARGGQVATRGRTWPRKRSATASSPTTSRAGRSAPAATARGAGRKPGPAWRRRPCGAPRSTVQASPPGATHHSPARVAGVQVHRPGPARRPADRRSRSRNSSMPSTARARRRSGCGRAAPASWASQRCTAVSWAMRRWTKATSAAGPTRSTPCVVGSAAASTSCTWASPSRYQASRSSSSGRAAPGRSSGLAARVSAMNVQNRCTSPRWYTRSACVQPGQCGDRGGRACRRPPRRRPRRPGQDRLEVLLGGHGGLPSAACEPNRPARSTGVPIRARRCRRWVGMTTLDASPDAGPTRVARPCAPGPAGGRPPPLRPGRGARRPRPRGAREPITVLLGPNGAGKTTAIRMITGALEARRRRRCARSASTPTSTARRCAAAAAWCRPSPPSTTASTATPTSPTRPSSTASAGATTGRPTASGPRPPASASSTRSTAASAASRPA